MIDFQSGYVRREQCGAHWDPYAGSLSGACERPGFSDRRTRLDPGYSLDIKHFLFENRLMVDVQLENEHHIAHGAHFLF